ncbi:MAG: ATP-binding protein, partial [Ketobacteraceae bacterium]|nr:ATP-binding protein [Ketobacteraceae bacterium]
EHKLWRDTFMEAPVPRRMGRGDEVRLKRKDGTLVPAEIGLSPISAQGHDYTIASIVDMSQAVNQKNALSRLNRQLAEKNREMEQFIYTVSHDLRSPLVTIEAFARKLATELAGQLSDKQAHRLTRIQANVSHMDQLLTDLLSLSRVIKRELQITTLDTSKLVAKLLNTLEAEISEVNADIAVEQPLLPLTANESLFYQCLQNLVVNAIKYRHPDRRLEIHIGTIKKDNMTGISVADNGVGIDEKYHEQIFGIFERLEQGSGTGVGLAIVNAIVEKHNGTIKLESAPGKGSCFTLFFPDLSDNEQY